MTKTGYAKRPASSHAQAPPGHAEGNEAQPHVPSVSFLRFSLGEKTYRFPQAIVGAISHAENAPFIPAYLLSLFIQTNAIRCQFRSLQLRKLGDQGSVLIQQRQYVLSPLRRRS